MGMPGQEWASMWPNSSVFILFIPGTFPESFIKIWWTKFEIYWKRYILGQILPNLVLNDGHAQARMGEHVTKLISIHSLYTKNICSKFHRNLMNQNRNMLENVHFGPDQPNCPAHFCPFCPKTAQRDFFQKNFTPYCPLTSCKKSEKTNDSIFFKVPKTSFPGHFRPTF